MRHDVFAHRNRVNFNIFSTATSVFDKLSCTIRAKYGRMNVAVLEPVLYP